MRLLSVDVEPYRWGGDLQKTSGLIEDAIQDASAWRVMRSDCCRRCDDLRYEVVAYLAERRFAAKPNKRPVADSLRSVETRPPQMRPVTAKFGVSDPERGLEGWRPALDSHTTRSRAL